MTRFSVLLPLLALSLTLGLSACESGSVRESLGLGKNPPDEFAVLTKAPLSLPPNYALRPPQPGQARPQSITPTEQARQSLLTNSRSAAAAQTRTARVSGAEASFLKQAGALGADNSIRTVVDQENPIAQEQTTMDRFLEGPASRQGATVVDADAERARIQAARQANQPVTGAEAKTTVEQEEGFWDFLW